MVIEVILGTLFGYVVSVLAHSVTYWCFEEHRWHFDSDAEAKGFRARNRKRQNSAVLSWTFSPITLPILLAVGGVWCAKKAACFYASAIKDAYELASEKFNEIWEV